MTKRMFILLVSAALYILDQVRTICMAPLIKKKAVRVVLQYHDVPAHERAAFARQMDVLCRSAIPISDLNSMPARSSGREIMVAFDDGFKSFVENALPELEKRNILATLFVVSSKLGSRPDWGIYWPGGIPEEQLLTGEQLKQLSGKVIFGSHTMTHPMLTEIDPGEARREIEGSRRELELLLECRITCLSLPYGAFNTDVIASCRAAGYEHVFSTLPGFAVHNDFIIGRVDADPADWEIEFRLKLAGCYRWLPWAYRVKRGLRGLLEMSTIPALRKVNR